MPDKLFGVVEGFYRRPYGDDERRELLQFMASRGLNCYVYAPKNDPYHRTRYQLPYPRARMRYFARINSLARSLGISFNLGIAPGNRPDLGAVMSKAGAFLEEGITSFSILFDDIHATLDTATACRQCEIANELRRMVAGRGLVFVCPTQYRGLRGSEYLTAMTRQLDRGIEIFWTGRRVVSWRITERDVLRARALYGRPPLIWDNLFANDYLPPGALLSFPYRFRSPAMLRHVRGVLLNPMNQLHASLPLIDTAAAFFHDPNGYVPRRAWREALRLKSVGNRLRHVQG